MPLSIRRNVLAMRPYSPGRPADDVKRETGLDRVVKLASNENAFGPSPKALEAVRLAASGVNVYPDGGAHELRQALSSFYDIDPDRLILGNGSDELLRLLGAVLIDGPEDQVLAGDPSFIVYDDVAKIAPCELVKVPLNSRFEHDLPAMARKLTDRTRIVFIANPNNPTGTIVRKREVEAFLDDVSDSTLVVLDEAYYEFARHIPDYPDSLEYVKAGRNVVGLRTFSKAYGLAGLRCGYGFAPKEIADAVERARPPFNVNLLAQAGATAALSDSEHLERTLAMNVESRERIAGALRRIGATPCESYANFVFADLGRPAAPVFEALMARGVVVRPGDGFGCPNGIRITVGTPDELDLLESALTEVFAEAAVS